jgi:hypothetical protein
MGVRSGHGAEDVIPALADEMDAGHAFAVE